MTSVIRVSMLPKEYQEIAKVIGVKAFLKLSKHYGGVNFTVPTNRFLSQHIRNTRIKRDFTGKNHKTLSYKYKLSEQQIQKIIDAPTTHLQTTIDEFIEQG